LGGTGLVTGAKHDSKALRYFVKGPHQTILISTILFPRAKANPSGKKDVEFSNA